MCVLQDAVKSHVVHNSVVISKLDESIPLFNLTSVTEISVYFLNIKRKSFKSEVSKRQDSNMLSQNKDSLAIVCDTPYCLQHNIVNVLV